MTFLFEEEKKIKIKKRLNGFFKSIFGVPGVP